MLSNQVQNKNIRGVMQYTSIQQHISKTVVLSILLCAGCSQLSGDNSGELTALPAARQYHQYTNFTPAGEENDKLPMEEAEDASEIEEELNALNQSGSWQDVPDRKIHSPAQPAESSLSQFPVVRNRQVDAYIRLFQGKQRRSFSRFLKRSGYYIDSIEKELASKGMPTELAYLAQVESGFNPRARSRANAIGLWQFMAGTGKDYNLKSNSYIDERCNVEKSTRAAINYLGDLYREFGDWYLAVAAYNAGPGKIRSGIKRYNVDNFWDLAAKKYLKMETVRYVPKLLATIIIARDPARFGFGNLQLASPLEFETLSVGPSLGLDAVALIAECKKEEIIRLNPELLRKSTPANQARYQIKIPKGRKTVARNNMKRLHSVASTAYKTHKIKKGDTLPKICKRYNINTTTLLKVNNLQSEKLAYGKTLRIPYSTVIYKLLPKGVKDAALLSSDDLVLHKVKRGDTLGAIAKKYRVPIKLIVSWNGLRSARSIRAGQQLALFIDSKSRDMLKTTSVKYIAASKSKHLLLPQKKVAESRQQVTLTAAKKKVSHTPRQKESAALYYNVQNGDSLWTISRKFRISMTDIKRWNSLKSNFLKPGETLKIKKS